MSISFLRHGPARVFSRHIGSTRTASLHVTFSPLTTEVLEIRLAMSAAATPAIQMLSATTTDSKSVTIEYQVNQASTATNPIQFGIYRSSNGQYQLDSDSLVDTVTLAARARRQSRTP